jgi:hypothetical protein
MVKAEVRATRDIWLTADGAMKEHTVVVTSFVDRSYAERYKGFLPRSTTQNFTVRGHGQLASPLLPGLPLLSYSDLTSLPSRVTLLRAVVARLASAVAQRGSAASSPAAQSARRVGAITTRAKVRPVGSCCGSGLVQRQAVRELNVIAWLLALPVPAPVRASLYRTAATLPGVRFDGPARDPLGRPGVSVSVGNGASEMRLSFDPRTGELLSTSVSLGRNALGAGVGPLTEAITRTGVVDSAKGRARRSGSA